MTKVCCNCKKKLPISEFYRNRSMKDGHESYCKACKNELKKTYNIGSKPGKRTKNKKQKDMAPTSHPDVLPFVVETPTPTLNLADMTDKELFEEIRRRGYTGDLRYSKVITI